MPYEIYKNVYFGNETYTKTDDCITKFSHILNVSDDEYATHEISKMCCECMWIYNRDEYGWNILGSRFDMAKEFIDNALKDEKNKVYIHCHEGINRSVAIAIAYRCLKTKENPKEIIKTLRNEGLNILSNKYFEDLLLKIY